MLTSGIMATPQFAQTSHHVYHLGRLRPTTCACRSNRFTETGTRRSPPRPSKLEDAQFPRKAARSARLAIALLGSARKVDVVLMDLQMPEMASNFMIDRPDQHWAHTHITRHRRNDRTSCSIEMMCHTVRAISASFVPWGSHAAA